MLDFVEYKASLDVHAAQNIEKRRNYGRRRHLIANPACAGP